MKIRLPWVRTKYVDQALTIIAESARATDKAIALVVASQAEVHNLRAELLLQTCKADRLAEQIAQADRTYLSACGVRVE